MIHDKRLSANRRWMPWTLRTPTLAALIVVSLLLAASIEILAQKSTKEGGLSLSESIDSIPQASLLASSYLPTLVAIIYGLLWAWIDLDAKRIQPWLELSKPDGATAQNSLFLDYPFEFLAFVPFRAARRRHWPVFYAGTIVVIVFWFITPLQSSIFGVGPVHISRQVLISAPTSMVDATDQAPLLDIGVLNDAFSITWLGQDFLPPMTADYALLPFNTNDDEVPSFANDAHLTSWTWQLTTDLNCWPAAINGSMQNFHFDNGQGCEVDVSFFGASSTPHDIQYSMLYVGYYDNAYVDYSLEGPSCSKNSTHQFLAISAARNATADISGDGSHISNYTMPNGNSVALSDSEFNITAFEYLLGTGRPPVDQTRDYPKTASLEQYFQLDDVRIEWPLTTMTGFIIGSRNYTATELHDPSTLAAACITAHKSLLSTTIARLLSNRTNVSPLTQTGVIQYTAYGVIVSRPISAVVEGLLLVVAILASCTLYHCARCGSRLNSDPSSISDILGMLQCSKPTLRDFVGHDCSDDTSLKNQTEGSTYFLRRKNVSGKISLCLYKSQHPGSRPSLQNLRHSSERDYKPIQPSALSPVAGASLMGVLLVGIVVLAYLKQQERNLGGLTPPSSNFEVMQLLENYTPTVFATLLEPFWVLVNRIYCVFQPFYELQKGRSIPQRLSGLFNEMPRVVTYKTMVQPERVAVPTREYLIPTTSPNAYSDHFQVVMANLSSETRLPPWTDNANFYLPFDSPKDERLNAGDQFKSRTLGFGIDYKCSPLGLNDLSGDIAVRLSLTNSTESIALSTKLPNGSYVDCNVLHQSPVYRDFPGQRSTREIFFGFYMGDICRSKTPLVAAWMRMHPTQHDPGYRSLNYTMLICQSHLQAAMFDVTVDTDSNIIATDQIGDPITHLEQWPANLSQSIVDEVARHNIAIPQDWHNKTVTTDWTNHLLTLMIGNQSLVDPAYDVPDPATMRPILEDLCRLLAATLFGLNPSFFQKATYNIDPIPASIIRVETRIFLSEPAFILSVSILAFYLLISVAVYTRARAILLPRMPTSLGSLLAYSVASQATEDFARRQDVGDNSMLNHTYTFGRYVGTDGKPHIGIERDPFVVKLDRGKFKRKGPYMPI
ncbi:hypothetical protein NPX13_g3672 [Xylaria arbuscula]|uniref:Uncharacterized protein n=1 Tax=Xylaria arbuscula TaxID=114810 RepID=A0A9W8TPV9_9PEZI|nr:hypothetical protein NPX13_g3672 [Xylaria arbuscula]